MPNADIVRAWKDPEYRASLSDAERAHLPHHPAGLIELSDEELGLATGARAAEGSNSCPSSYTCPYTYSCPTSYTCPTTYTCPQGDNLEGFVAALFEGVGGSPGL